MTFPHPTRHFFSRSCPAVFFGVRVGDYSPLALSLAYATILLLCGCATVKPVDRSDRPWAGKPDEVELDGLLRAEAMAAPPAKTFPILCDTRPCGIIGLRWGLERSADLKVWQLVATSPALATGGTVTFMATNDQPRAFYRVRSIYPP